MHITTDQKNILTSTGVFAEQAFLSGVESGAAYLPPAPGYETIPADLRATGVSGLLSTFSAFLKGLASHRPTLEALQVVNGFNVWADPEYQPTGVFLNPTGEVVLQGQIVTPTSAVSGVTFAVLPVGMRPAKKVKTTIVYGSGTAPIVINPTGTIELVAAVSSTTYLSLDGVRFYPA